MDLQKKVQDVLDRAVENGTECGQPVTVELKED